VVPGGPDVGIKPQNQSYVPPRGGSPKMILVSSAVYMDRDKVGRAVTTHIVRQNESVVAAAQVNGQCLVYPVDLYAT
jgi:hypothetical protein